MGLMRTIKISVVYLVGMTLLYTAVYFAWHHELPRLR
jgi:hypothetical protein